MTTMTTSITDEQIETLMSEAAEAGDTVQVMTCRIALGLEHVSDVEATADAARQQARAECARAIAAAEAMAD